MDEARILSALLETVVEIPSPVPWGISPLRSLGLLLIVDARPEATTMIMEAIANHHGEVVAIASIEAVTTGREILGCLIRPSNADLIGAAKELRSSYAISTGAGADEPPENGF